jgi:tetratricopeptide (TPR) repeat protein
MQALFPFVFPIDRSMAFRVGHFHVVLELWAMTKFRTLLFLALLFCGLPWAAQAQSEELAREIKYMSGLLRTEPPERTLARADSLLASSKAKGDPRWRMELTRHRGHALRLMRRFDEALQAQIDSYTLADSIDDRVGLMEAILAQATIHMDLDDLERANQKIAEAQRLHDEQPGPGALKLALVRGAWCDYRQMGDSALYWARYALPLAQAARDSFVMADLHFNLGITSSAMGDLPDGEAQFKRALAVLPASGYPHLEARVNESLAYLYLEQGRYTQVPALLARAESIARAHGASEIITNVWGDRIDLHLATGDTAAAVELMRRLFDLKDSLAMGERTKLMAEAEARFGVTRMEKELALTKAEAEANALRAQRSRIAWGALAIISALAIFLVISFRRQYKLKQQAAVMLERDKERLLEENELLHQENLMARFETLKSQIDPHFLFNAMNTLYTLVETEPGKAREFIASFSALYRKVLTSRERTIVPISEELELVRHYLFLQRMRFGESLKVNVDVPARAMKGYLPPFTLQMLLENAIKHNVISAAKPLHITLSVEGDQLLVRNDLRPRGTSEAGTGTGLENIRRRYTMLGAPEPSFTMSDTQYTAIIPILSQEP